MPVVLRNRDILVISGDVSGDFHAANLIRELKKQEPSLIVYSIGGLRSREVSDRFIYDVVSKGVFGFVSSIKSIQLWIKLISIVRRFIEEKRPAFVITVDFFGFNRQVLGLCKKRQVPVYYYIPPQVWASRPKRAKTVAANSKKIYAVFPFELDIYTRLLGNVRYFGHPLSDFIPDVNLPRIFPDDRNIKIAILPGSRKCEIEMHLPVFYEVFSLLKKDFPSIEGYVFMVDEFSEIFYRSIIDIDSKIRFVYDRDYSIRKNMDFCLTCSGTATLENALLGIPMVVGYKTSFINYELAKALIRIPYISLPNIILSRESVKEFIQHSFKASVVYRHVLDILKNRSKYEKISQDMLEIKRMLSSSQKVVTAIAKDIISDFDIL
ncbi:MAG: lipid-A-disaccharide synthase [Elusimicrobiales bacterium]